MITKEDVQKKLDSIEEVCGWNFDHLPDEYGYFCDAWEMYCENILSIFDPEDDDYLMSINVDDFIDWAMVNC